MRAGCAGLILLLVSACGGQPEDKNISVEAADLAIAPGLWETTSEIVGVSAPGLPYEVRRRMLGSRPSARGCITPEQAGRLVAGRTCAYRDFIMTNGRLSGRMTCPALPRPTIATIEGRYEARHYGFSMRMLTAMPDGAAMTIEVRGRGRRLGDCPTQPAKERAGS